MPPDTYLTRDPGRAPGRAAADARRPRRPRRRGPLAVPADAALRAEPGHAGRAGTLAVIAEIKRRSPSKGDLDPDLDPAAVARDYEAGGAACLSVLTDERLLRRVGRRPGGGPRRLRPARAAQGLHGRRRRRLRRPAHGRRRRPADRGRPVATTSSATFLGLARELALDALVEVHDEDELDRALDAGAELVGVNQRDLHTFAVDHGRALRLVGAIPPDVVAVAESGIRGAERRGAPGRRRLPGRARGRDAGRGRPTAPVRCGRSPGTGWGHGPGRTHGPGRDEVSRCSSRSAASPRRPTPSWPWASGPTPSASSSPLRRARSRPRRCGASSSGCRPRS